MSTASNHRSSESNISNKHAPPPSGQEKQTTGSLVETYENCLWENSSGNLLVGSKGISFSGYFLLFERKFTVQWEDVRSVQKLGHGIELTRSNGDRYYFDGIHAPDRAWSLLVSLHNEALLDRKAQRASPHHAVQQRRKSDPACEFRYSSSTELSVGNDEAGSKVKVAAAVPTASPTSSDETSQIEKVAGDLRLRPISCTYKGVRGKMFAGEEALFFRGKRFFWEMKEFSLTWNNVETIRIVGNNNDETSKRPCTGIQLVLVDGTVHELNEVEDIQHMWAHLLALHNEKLTQTQAMIRRRKLRRTHSDPQTVDHETETLKTDESDSTADKSLVVEPAASERCQLSLAGECLQHQVVMKRSLDYTLDSFYDTFLADGAKQSIATYMENKGDSFVTTSAWQHEDGDVYTRNVNYTHPVNVPMAPPVAAASKEQTYRRFGKEGLVVETKTFVKDVPMTDCFYINDRIVVLAADAGGVELTMDFELVFIKPTMFKGIIARTSHGEVSKYLAEYADFFASASSPKADEHPLKAQSTEQKSSLLPGSTRDPIARVLLCWVAFCQLWILWEVQKLSKVVRVVEARGGALGLDSEVAQICSVSTTTSIETSSGGKVSPTLTSVLTSDEE